MPVVTQWHKRSAGECVFVKLLSFQMLNKYYSAGISGPNISYRLHVSEWKEGKTEKDASDS